MANHCLLCGNKHEGECSPGSFVYYKCSNCNIMQKIPWDAVAFGGLTNTFCACDKPAIETWKEINYENYKCD